MNNKTTLPTTVSLKSLLLFLITLFSVITSAQTSEVIVRWSTASGTGPNGLGISPLTPSSINENLSSDGLIRGSAITVQNTPPGGVPLWGGTGGWSTNNNAGQSSDNFSFYFTVTVNNDSELDLTQLKTNTRRSSSGPNGYRLYYSINNAAFVQVGTQYATPSTGAQGSVTTVDLESLPVLTANQTIKFRITPYGSSNGNYFLINADAIVIEGILSTTNTPCTTPVPVATAQTFCSPAVVGDLLATGNDIKWYATASSTNVLTNTTALATGTYYVTQTQNNCESPKKAVEITVNQTAVPGGAASQAFCNQATIADITVTGTDIKWYASQTSTDILAPTTVLSNGTTYYATQTVNGCTSVRKAVAVTINTTAAPAAVSQTFCNQATVANLTATGTALKWYATATATTALTSTTALTNTTYYVSQTLNGCESPRTAVQVNINQTAQPVADAQTFCGSTTVAALQATGSDIKWYATNSSTTALTNTTAVTTGTYYVTQTINGCESSKKAVTITVNQTALPAATDQVFCNEATINNLTATGTAIKWYASETSTQVLASTTTLTNNTTYYVTQTINSCESGRKPVLVTIHQTAIPAATDQVFCAQATIADLSATGTALKWYATNSSTEVLPSDTVLTNATTYYVSQTLNNCESARKAVMVTINTTPMPTATDQVFCTQATAADLTATGSTIKWYASLTATEALQSNTALSTGTYYATQTVNSCESERKAVAVTIHQTPQPTASSQTFCSGATLQDLTATGTSLKWYASATSTEVLAFDTILSTGTYYVTQTIEMCESTRRAVTVTVHQTPAPTAATQTFCANATLTSLSATGQNIKWYASTTSTEVLPGTTVLTTGTYYATQTLNNCESIRKAVAVVIKDVVTPLATQHINVCNATVLSQLNAMVNSTGIIKWYASSTAQTPLSDTTVLTSGTYYATRSIDQCESQKTAFQITVLPALNKPSAALQTFCGSATVADLVAQGVNGATLSWYSSATAQEALSNGTVLTTGVYYVAQNLNTCSSERRAVTVKIINMTAPQVNNFQFCGNATVADLHIIAPTGITYRWYTTATASTALTQNTQLTTTTYYVAKVEAGCESLRKAVTVTINSIPDSPTGSLSQTFEEGAVIGDLVMDQLNVVWHITYNDAVNGYNPLSNGMPLQNNKTYYAVIIGTNGCPSLPTPVTVQVTLGLDGFDKDALQFYPNPIENSLTIRYSEILTGIEIYDMSGRRVGKELTSSTEITTDMSHLSAGVYMIKLTADSKEQLIKVIKK